MQVRSQVQVPGAGARCGCQVQLQVWLVHLERRVWVVLLVLARNRVPGVPRVPTLPGHLRRGCRDNMASMYNCSW